MNTTIFYDALCGRIRTGSIASSTAVSDPVYITIDVDGIDPAIMPATGTPEPGGLSWYEILALLRATIAKKTVVACDLVELSPLPGHHGSELPLCEADLQDPDVPLRRVKDVGIRVRRTSSEPASRPFGFPPAPAIPDSASGSGGIHSPVYLLYSAPCQRLICTGGG